MNNIDLSRSGITLVAINHLRRVNFQFLGLSVSERMNFGE